VAPSLLLQASLFEEATGSPIERIALGPGSWVDLARGWLPGADPLFVTLLDHLPWEQRERPMYHRVVSEPRLTAAVDPALLPVPEVERLRAAKRDLEVRYGVPLGEPWVNLYRDGSDSVAWHGDRIGRKATHAVVAIISLGTPRPFLMRPAGGGPSRRFEVGQGDLLVMGGRAQHTHEHCVPKRAHVAGPRMSITWRWSDCPTP
jgi:alkylated DNA repair dioxygenase AlkB